MHTPNAMHSRALRNGVALVVTLALCPGCAVLSKLFGGKKEEAKEVAAVTPPKEEDPPPQAEYSEAQWAEYTAAAEAKVREAEFSDLVPPLRLVGGYPGAAQTVEVKGGYCYAVGLAWSTPERGTAVTIDFLKDAEGQRSNSQRSSSRASLSAPAGVAQFCVDRDGSVQIQASLLDRTGSVTYGGPRKDPVQWAAVLAARKEDPAAQDTRREAEAAQIRKKRAQGRANIYRNEVRKYGSEVADFCEKCRKMTEMCFEERKADRERANEYCSLTFDTCVAPLGRSGGSRVCSPP